MAAAAAAAGVGPSMDEIWEDLRCGLIDVYNRQAMSYKRYMDLYS
jgi:hypothetical protein